MLRFWRAALGAGSAISGLFLVAAALIGTFASTTTVKAVTLGDPLHGACPTCVHQNVGEIFDASGSFRHSLTEKFFDERTNKDVTDEVNSVSKSAQFEGDSFAGSLAAEVPAAFAGNTPEEASALLKKTQLFRIADVSEKVFTTGHEEEPKRPDDIAPDLVAVRAELAKCIAAETAARGQIAYLTKWLEDNEKLSEVALDAERNRSDGIARDLAAVRAELADRITAEASARNEIAQLTKLLESSEKELATKLSAERVSDGKTLATVRAELADRISAEASARMEIEQLTKRLATNEKELATKLNAELVSDGKTLATVRAELADRITAEASARKEIEQLTKQLAANEKEWTTKLNAERVSDGRTLATVRAELADRITAEASARKEIEQLTKRLAANEKEWTTKLNAERVSDGKTLATVRAELADRISAEASARMEIEQLTKRLATNEKELATKLNAERVSEDKTLATVRAELADRISAEASARMEIEQLTKRLATNEKELATKLNAELVSDGKTLATVRAELADRVSAEASARNEIAQLTKLLESSEKELATKLSAERVSDGKTLATVRAELADRIGAEASARKEIEQLTKRLATNEKELATKLNAERERSDGAARDLAAVRAELADRINVEASTRRDKTELEKLIKANETEWTNRLNAELERSEVIARDLATVQAELAKRIAAEASAPPNNDFTSTIKSAPVPTDRMATVIKRDPSRVTIGRSDNSTSRVVALAVDEAKWMARAQFLIGQGDVAGARHFLERVAEGGSANAAFLLAETYDWRMLRALQVYGVRGDTKRAMDLYGMALEGGIDKAKERISALERGESP